MAHAYVPGQVAYDETWKREPILANADTGSEIDLVSADFCYRRNLPISKKINGGGDPMVQFADGSTASVLGQIQLRVVIGKFRVGSFGKALTFYVLEDLTCSMLLGEGFLNESNAFEAYKDAFTIDDDEDLAQVNTIIWLKKWERWLSRNKSETPVGLDSASGKCILRFENTTHLILESNTPRAERSGSLIPAADSGLREQGLLSHESRAASKIANY